MWPRSSVVTDVGNQFSSFSRFWLAVEGREQFGFQLATGIWGRELKLRYTLTCWLEEELSLSLITCYIYWTNVHKLSRSIHSGTVCVISKFSSSETHFSNNSKTVTHNRPASLQSKITAFFSVSFTLNPFYLKIHAFLNHSKTDVFHPP